MNGNHGLHEEAACWCIPAEFVRPRFFYGQRLGVVDFSDWLWYHAGKQRHHNLLAHGVGVLCGLRAERFVRPGEVSTTLLRVTRGAAYDACGREIVVGVDQCIDVAAWFGHDRELPADWLAGAHDRRLWVGLRYRECPSDPTPAPRDPCGCDAGGCEYSRVREGFELRLFTPDAVPEPATTTAYDSYYALLEALAAHPDWATDGGAALGQILHDLVPRESPPPGGDEWLWLACFAVTLDEAGEQVLAIDDVDNATAHRRALLGVGALQEMLLGMAHDAGVFRAGPRITAIEYDPSDANAIRLAVSLYQPAGALEPTPLADATVRARRRGFRLRRFDARRGWVQLGTADGTYDSRSRHLRIAMDSNLVAGAYRLTIASSPDRPIADAEMRPLLPMNYARNFELAPAGRGVLALG